MNKRQAPSQKGEYPQLKKIRGLPPTAKDWKEMQEEMDKLMGIVSDLFKRVDALEKKGSKEEETTEATQPLEESQEQ